MAFSAVTERGSANEKLSDTSLGVSPSANITVGKIAFAVIAFDNIATTDGATTTNDSVTDTDGHTWNKVAERTNTAAGVAADGVTGSLWWTLVTTQIDTGDVVTFNVDSATVAKVIGLFEVTVGAGQTIQLAGSAFIEDDTTDLPALTISGLPSKEYLFIGVAWRETNQTSWAEDADYTNVYALEGIATASGGAATQITINVGYRIFTGTGDTFDVAGLTITQNAGGFFAFEEVSAGGGTQNLTGALFTKAPTFFTGVVTRGAVALTGSLFTKAPTFFTGVLTARYNLTGTLFVKAPTFFTGAVTATRALTGVLFTKAPTFPTGVVAQLGGPQALTGALFTKAPTFPTGTLLATYSLAGTLFVKAPTFFTGTVTSGAVTLNGVLFTKAPTFPQGAITTGAVALTGVLFQKAPTFFIGTVTAGVYPLTGTLYVNTPVFFTGTIGQAGTLFGNLYVNTPLFFTGTMGQVGGSFWRPNPAGYTLNPAAFVRVGPNDLPPWAIEIHGNTFTKAPSFPVGAVT